MFWNILPLRVSALMSAVCFFFFFNRHCNPCGFRPAQLLLSILSRKVFTECCCQRHVKPPTWRTSDLNVPTPATRCPHVWNDASESQQRNVELWARNCREFCRKWRLPRQFCVLTTWDRRLYFPAEGRRAEDFFTRKIRRLRPGLNPRTWVPEASTLNSRPPKPLNTGCYQSKFTGILYYLILYSNFF